MKLQVRKGSNLVYSACNLLKPDNITLETLNYGCKKWFGMMLPVYSLISWLDRMFTYVDVVASVTEKHAFGVLLRCCAFFHGQLRLAIWIVLFTQYNKQYRYINTCG